MVPIVYLLDRRKVELGRSATFGALYPCVPHVLAGESPLEAEPDKGKRPHNRIGGLSNACGLS
jgi:hypothetical protein